MNGNIIFNSDINMVLANINGASIIRRIWEKDYTVWKPHPDEICNRLGWLTIPEIMYGKTDSLYSFARQCVNDGIKNVILLGMGGSSLGSAVLCETLNNNDNFPELLVLDSTVPDAVKTVRETIDPHNALFIVSSKSGSTIEPMMAYRYFRDVVKSAVGEKEAGDHFIAVTDANTPLAKLAVTDRFLHIFINPSDIGGRYSVLSYFGLLPSALIGIDIQRLISQAISMKQMCAADSDAVANPGAVLGSFIAANTLQHRDKMTLFFSPSISSFGIWIEQLVAESTGKEGKGILPVIDEPVYDSYMYGEDRQFVFTRLESDENSAMDDTIKNIRSTGKPVLVINIQDKYDLGAEFFRWEFATAVAGALLGINPFDQPDVQQSKMETESILKQFQSTQTLPAVECATSIQSLMAGAVKGDYCAVMAYIEQTCSTDEQLRLLRQKITTRYKIPTTAGYGPRYLHSTGQFHKGGPDSGLFLQIVNTKQEDMGIPGTPYTFGVIAEAQALGDIRALQSARRKVVRIAMPYGLEKFVRNIIV